MEDHPGARITGSDRIGQRIGHELGTQVIGQGEPGDAAGLTLLTDPGDPRWRQTAATPNTCAPVTTHALDEPTAPRRNPPRRRGPPAARRPGGDAAGPLRRATRSAPGEHLRCGRTGAIGARDRAGNW